MKIKFIKEYQAFLDFEGSFEASNIYKVGDTKNVATEAAQWLIDNGFAEEVKEFGWWKPKFDEEYFYIGHDSFVHPWLWKNDQLDKGRLRLGLAFKTEEAGICCRDYLEAIATVRQDEGVLTPEQIRKMGQRKDIVYTIAYIGKKKLSTVTCDLFDVYPCVGVIYFDTREQAQASLDKHPDEWKIIANYDWSRE